MVVMTIGFMGPMSLPDKGGLVWCACPNKARAAIARAVCCSIQPGEGKLYLTGLEDNKPGLSSVQMALYLMNKLEANMEASLGEARLGIQALDLPFRRESGGAGRMMDLWIDHPTPLPSGLVGAAMVVALATVVWSSARARQGVAVMGEISPRGEMIPSILDLDWRALQGQHVKSLIVPRSGQALVEKALVNCGIEVIG